MNYQLGKISLSLTRISRLAIDLGVPLVSIGQLLGRVKEQYGKDPEYDHPFYKQVYEMIQEDDHQAILDERVPIKLLRLEPAA